MDYLIPCKAIGQYKKVDILTGDFDVIGTITFHKEKKYDVKVLVTDQEPLFVQSKPLKRNNRFVIFNNANDTIAAIKVGVKIIHSIIERDHYYFVKASFWTMHYRLFDNRTKIGDLKVIRIHKKRYFKITMDRDDFVFAIALFLLAHAVRIKSLMS